MSPASSDLKKKNQSNHLSQLVITNLQLSPDFFGTCYREP